MRLNNKSIRGIYLYDTLLKDEYEPGDLVVVGSTIYVRVVDGTGIVDLDGTADKNYNIYLGNKLVSVEEYLSNVNNYSNSGDEVINEDSYVTSHLLSSILNHYMSGFDEKGVISYEVVRDEVSGSIILRDLLRNLIISDSNKILDEILVSEDLNNTMIKVPRQLLSPYLKQATIANEEITGSAALSVLLRQYTYKEESSTGTTLTVRLQEVIDPIAGLTIYRRGERLNTSDEYTIFSWYQGDVTDTFLEDINRVRTYYNSKLVELDVLKTTLVNNFAFRNVRLPSDVSRGVTLKINTDTNMDDSGVVMVKNNFLESTIITVVVSETISSTSRVIKNHSINIDLSETVNEFSNGTTKYYLSDNCSLEVVAYRQSNNEFDPTKVDIRVSGLAINSSKITNIYQRYYYGE